MAKNTFLDWDQTASNNTDIGGIGIQGTNAVSNFDDALRTVMAQLRAGVDGEVAYITKSANYTAALNDNNSFLRFSSAATLSLTAAATLGANWHIYVVADGADVVIDPNASETIDGKTTLTVRNGTSAIVICDGTNFRTNLAGGYISQKGHLSGLTLANNSTDAVNDVDIAVGECASDGTVPYLMALTSGITKRLDAAWAVGSGNGGLDTGSIANTTYHVWLIQRSDTGVIDALLSASATSPTMPSNYDRKRRIGPVIRLSGSILPFTQVVDEFTLTNSALDVNLTSLGTTAVTQALTVPTGIPVQANISLTLNVASSGTFILVSPLSTTDETPSSSNCQAGGNVINQTDSSALRVLTNSSAQIRYRSSAVVTVTSLVIRTRGWTDTRGRG